MSATTRVPQSTAPVPTLYLAFELGSTKWTLACAVSPAHRPRGRTIAARNLERLRHEIAMAKLRFGIPADGPVVTCYEAGRDGFWVHRWLVAQGVVNLVVDSSSIEVNRRQRQAKTDRLDAGKLLRLLMRWAGGERHVWSVVRIPTVEAEDQRQLTRELATVREDGKRVRNRIAGLLATQGIALRGRGRFLERLALMQTGDGRALPPALAARVSREWAHLQVLERRYRELETMRDTAIASGTDRVAVVARQLCRLRGVAETSAAVFSAELFGTRDFRNRRHLGALSGFVPTPYRSDQRVQDQGISKAGRAELRRVATQAAWNWIRWQPDSALTQWFQRRFGQAGARSRRIGVIAVARKLLIALWRFVRDGVIPADAVLKVA